MDAVIFGPGIYDNIDAAAYHTDPCKTPSLSSSIASLLLSATPKHAWQAHPRLNPDAIKQSTKAMDLGSVAHEIILGKGSGYEVSPFDDYRTRAAQDWRDDTIARGLIPIKGADFANAMFMAHAVWQSVLDTSGAEPAFHRGVAESVVIWAEGGSLCRALIDWSDPQSQSVFDLKTTGRGISDQALQARINGAGGPGLDLQAAFHVRGLETIVGKSITFYWVFAENEPPFECRVVEMDAMTRKVGNLKVDRALSIWSECMATGNWPGYTRKIEKLDYRDWAAEKWIGEMHL